MSNLSNTFKKEMVRSRKTGWFAGSTLAAVVALFGTTGAAMADPVDDKPAGIHIDLSNPTFDSLRDSNGQPVKFLEDVREAGQRTVLAETVDGSPVVVRVYSAPPTTPAALPDPAEVGRDAVENWTAGPRPPVEEEFSGEDYPVDEGSFVPHLAVASTADSVTVAVFGAQSVDSATRDGGRVDDRSAKPDQIVDTGLEPGATYTYVIEAILTESWETARYSLDVRTPDPAASSSLRASRVASTAAAVQGQAIQYTTFIEPEWVEGQDVFNCIAEWDRAFAGDGRGFTEPYTGDSANFRTQVVFDPWFPRPTIYTSKQVHPTRLFEVSTGNLVDERTAPDTGITFSDQQSSTTYAQVRVNHSAGNPFCAVGAISYSALFRAYSSGLVEVIGTRLPAPHHEVWVLPGSIGTASWEQLAGYESEGFVCLTGICGERSTNASGIFD